MRVAAILAFLFILPALQANAQIEEQGIAAQAQLLAKALPAGDAAALNGIVSKDFQFVDVFGHTGGAIQWIERFKALLAMAKDPVVTSGPGSVTPKGTTNLAIFRLKVQGVGKDRLGDEGPLDMTLTIRTEWEKGSASWSMKSAKEVRFEGTANRRPIAFSKTTAEEATRKGFEAMYGAVSEIYEKRDWDKMEKGIGDDFVIHDMDGKQLTKKELIDRVKAGSAVVNYPIMTMDPQQVAFEGDKLYVIRVMRLLGDVSMPDGKTGRVIYINIARDTFTKDDKTWKPKGSDELHAEATVNGIPVPLSMLAGK